MIRSSKMNSKQLKSVTIGIPCYLTVKINYLPPTPALGSTCHN